MIRLAWAERSDIGMRRTTNEDAVLASPPVFAVADGMGGHAAGDVAAELTVRRLGELTGRSSLTSQDVLDAIRSADDDIANRAMQDSTAGMGTTLTGFAVTGSDSEGSTIVVFNVGDSRSYVLRGATLTQISRDHSVVQELIDDGVITADQAGHHPERHVITRSLGGFEPLEIDWWALTPQAADRLLLCSDGLCRHVTDPEISALLVDHDEPDDAADALLQAALDGGGSDNISLVVVDIVAVTAPGDGDQSTVTEMIRGIGRPATDPSGPRSADHGRAGSGLVESSYSTTSRPVSGAVSPDPFADDEVVWW